MIYLKDEMVYEMLLYLFELSNAYLINIYN